MKVLIFGATGSLGRHIVDQALAQGHFVTAFVRDPAKLNTADPALTIVRGDVMNPADVDTALPGHEAVLIALGAGAKGKIRATGTRHVIEAMQTHSVRRLICLSSLGVGDSRGNLNFLWKYVMFGILLRRAYADHVAQEQTVRESGLDWTVVRPGAFVDGGVTGSFRHGFPKDTKGLKLKVSRADVAGFMLEQLASDAYLRRLPGLSY